MVTKDEIVSAPESITFSLVSTVFNESDRVRNTIDDLEAQSRSADEVIIVDAGSTDGTFEILSEWSAGSRLNVTVIQIEGCNVAKGRNHAIGLASCDIIVSTDFGCRFHREWLESIVNPFELNPELEVVGGAFTIDRNEVKTIAQRADFILQKGYSAVLDENFSVSSRSIAYKKGVWEKIGGYPEWLTLAADDTIFWRQVKGGGFKYTLIDKPYVTWMRHRTFNAFGKEANRYGLGDGEGGINRRTFLSHVVETTARYTLLIHLTLIPLYLSTTAIPLLVFVPQLFGLRSYRNAFRRWLKWKSQGFGIRVLAASFWMIEVCRINYLCGYTKGSMGRTKNQKEASRRLRFEIS